MLNISQFAKECKTTVKTIRHYDNIGLLSADYVSDENGYRFYRRKSITKYYQILALKQSGFTLSEIKEITGSFNLPQNLDYIEQKILLLKKQQSLCESIKKEYEKIMTESNKFTVSVKNHQLSILSRDSENCILINANPDISEKCASLLEASLNSEQIINIDYNDLKENISDKTAISFGSYYSPNCRLEDFDNLLITREEEKTSDLIAFFETSPDTSPQQIGAAIESFLTSFACDVNVLFSANAESGEKGVTLKWICFK